MIKFTNVSFSFGNTTVLHNISMHVKPGEFVFLVGQTGSGKSTLLRLIYMDVQPAHGSVVVGKYSSASIVQGEKPHLRRTLGIVFQDFRLLEDRNVFDNVAFTLQVTGAKGKEIKKRVLHALADVGLSHQRNKMPHELSGGEQQRIAVARALVNNPLVLLADEPTGNLDPDTSHEILELLKNINTRGTAIIMATHNYNLVRKMHERILQLQDGKLIEIQKRVG